MTTAPLPTVPYAGVMVKARLVKLVQSYIVQGQLVEDADGNAIHPPRHVRTAPVLKYFKITEKLISTDSFYHVKSWDKQPAKEDFSNT